MTPSELELIESYAYGRMPEEKLPLVFELLEQDASARAYLRTISAVDSWLSDHAIADSEMRESIIFQDFVHDPGNPKFFPSKHKSRQVIIARRYFSPRNLIAAAAAIAGIATIISLLAFNINREREQFVATVEYISNDTQLVTPDIFDGNKRASTAPIEMTSGVLKLRFNHGAAVTLHGPSRFIPTDEHGGRLVHGILVGKAPINHSGLRIAGPNFDVTDLGTEFAVKVDKTYGSDLFVIEGSVALRQKNGAQIIAKSDNGFHIDGNNKLSILNKEQITKSFSKILNARHDPLGILTQGTVAYLLFAGKTSDAWRDLAVDVQIPATVPADPQTGAAILNGTNGISIRERTDLLIDSPMSFEALIYIDRADYLDPLFSIHGRIPENRFGWGVVLNKGAGGSLFPVFQYYNAKQYDFSRVSLPVGRWVHFMFNVDGRMVQLYVNGVLQGELPYAGPMIRANGAGMHIGIGGRGSRRPSQFLGKVSYFAVHNRVLTSQEIENRIKLGSQP